MRHLVNALLLITSLVLASPAETDLDFKPSLARARQIELVSSHLVSRTDEFAREEAHFIAVTLVRTAERHGLDPELLLAMIEVESGYGRRGKSPVGALGLMQLLPSTAEAFAQKAGVKWRGPRSLFDPEINIEIGVTYFAHLLERFDGDTELALAAYCHGPGAIRRSLRENGALSRREKRYGQRVMARLRSLRRVQGEPRAET